MDFKNKKNLLIAGGVVVVLIIALWMIMGGGSSNPDTSLTPIASDPLEFIIGREMLASLDQMRAVQLDVSFFDNLSYKGLKDFTVQIPKQPIGRRDPFAPI